jgi:hypothetical protein
MPCARIDVEAAGSGAHAPAHPDLLLQQLDVGGLRARADHTVRGKWATKLRDTRVVSRGQALLCSQRLVAGSQRTSP